MPSFMPAVSITSMPQIVKTLCTAPTTYKGDYDYDTHLAIIIVTCTNGAMLARYSGLKPKPYSTREYLFCKTRVCAACTVAIDC